MKALVLDPIRNVRAVCMTSIADLTSFRRRARDLLDYLAISSTARAVMKHNLTYLSAAKMRRLEKALADAVKATQGDIAEFGIALGGSAIVLAKQAVRHHRSFHGFDVFGMIPPPVSDYDDHLSKHRYEIIASGRSEGIKGSEYYGYKKDLYTEVCKSFEDHGIPVDGISVNLYKGLFSDTLSTLSETPISFAHLDCDWYDPVKLCLTEIARRSVVGTTIVLDDFNDWSGCRQATLEFLSERTEYSFDHGPNVVLKRIS